ncbi:unnamed protein product [Callosobruchus maculatus]|uniref:Bee-milk protein n=1 Tax=Callosobruchus maculatus TaxID=64391 RepID=A0A653DBI0_CALMS|nr:unnamed protein product [Callosobruchus maculatus]
MATCTIFFNVLTFTIVSSLSLEGLGFDDNYFVSSVAIHGTRTFLALPRSVCFNTKKSNPTLVEISKAGDRYFYTPGIFDNARQKVLGHQQWGECDHLQDVISIDMQPQMMTKLWILDKGNKKCPPKVVSFTLIYNTFSESTELSGISGRSLNIIEIDHSEYKDGSRAYIGYAGENKLIVLSLNNLKWWKIRLIQPTNPVEVIKVDYLAKSKTDSKLYITSKTGNEVYAMNTRDVKNLGDIKKGNQKVNVTYEGDKLGRSTGIETDYKAGLNYYMISDYVILRWIIGSPMKAEYHSVLAQSYDRLPYVSGLFTGPQRGLWAIVNPGSPDMCNQTGLPKVQRRFVKILKFNAIYKDLEIDDQYIL